RWLPLGLAAARGARRWPAGPGLRLGRRRSGGPGTRGWSRHWPGVRTGPSIPSDPVLRSNDRGLGYGHDEFRAPFPGVGQLLGDLVLEVPRKDEDVVGPSLVEAFGGENRDVGSR